MMVIAELISVLAKGFNLPLVISHWSVQTRLIASVQWSLVNHKGAPPQLKIAKIKLSKQQWHNRNKQFGNRKKAIRASNKAKQYFGEIAKTHAHLANIRQDFLQKTTTDISRNYYRIRIEDLNISQMMANHKLSNAIANLGLYEFRRMLTYKQPFFGTRVELVDRWFPSSKTCCECGHIQSMPLSERVFVCEAGCGNIRDRDENASINLRDAPFDKIRLA
ncbi:RNA-guided endonuclease InsQ/TnpB family protein [Nostoc commune]|nr:RNA-guided endonuclease TnpB family protein [Nostoc commune]